MSEQRFVFLLSLTFVMAMAGLTVLIVAKLFAPELHAVGAAL